jgi:hypothetical protein
MTMIGDQLTQLAIVEVDAGQPGVLVITLDEQLQCGRCGNAGAEWRIPLGPGRDGRHGTDGLPRRHEPGAP